MTTSLSTTQYCLHRVMRFHCGILLAALRECKKKYTKLYNNIKKLVDCANDCKRIRYILTQQ